MLNINLRLTFLILLFSLFTLNARAALTIGTSPDYPPHIFTNASGSIIGYEYDFVSEVCNLIGEKCVWKKVDWESLPTELKAGNIDMIVSALGYSKSRETIIDLSDPIAIDLKSKPGSPNKISIGVKKGNSALLKKLNPAIAKVINSGASGQIASNYKASNISPPSPSNLVVTKQGSTEQPKSKPSKSGIQLYAVIGRYPGEKFPRLSMYTARNKHPIRDYAGNHLAEESWIICGDGWVSGIEFSTGNYDKVIGFSCNRKSASEALSDALLQCKKRDPRCGTVKSREFSNQVFWGYLSNINEEREPIGVITEGGDLCTIDTHLRNGRFVTGVGNCAYNEEAPRILRKAGYRFQCNIINCGDY